MDFRRCCIKVGAIATRLAVLGHATPIHVPTPNLWRRGRRIKTGIWSRTLHNRVWLPRQTNDGRHDSMNSKPTYLLL